MQTEAWAVLGTSLAGGFGTIKAYFHYRVQVMTLQHQMNHEIEDRRQGLESDRQKANGVFLEKFEATVKALREQIEALKTRMDASDKLSAQLEADLEFCKQWLERVNAHFEKRKTTITEVAPGVTRVGEKK